MANSIFIWPGVSSSSGGGGASFAGAVTSGGAGNTTGSFYAADGTALLPAYSFTSEPTLGFWRSAAGMITAQGNITTSGFLVTPNLYVGAIGTSVNLRSAGDGRFTINNNATTIGSMVKVDALPTVASGGGGTIAASVTAGSTPFAGSVNVGTGVITNPLVLNFNGTAFPSAPFAVAINNTTAALLRCSATTTQLTITGAVTFLANDILSWHCISSR